MPRYFKGASGNSPGQQQTELKTSAKALHVLHSDVEIRRRSSVAHDAHGSQVTGARRGATGTGT